MTLQSELLSHIVTLKYEDLPAPVIEATKKSVLDTLACLIAGSTDEFVPEIVELVKGWRGKAECTLAVHGGKVPAPQAALVNCTMARARDFDEVHNAGGGHVGATIVPATLVLSEYSKLYKNKVISGKDYILAHAMGADILCRIPKGRYAPGPFRESGWTSETWGPFAVAALGGKLLGFDETQIRNALGIAYTRLSGNAQVYSESAYTGRLQQGFAGEGGVISVVLADHGLMGAAEVMEGNFGIYPLYFRGQYLPERFLDELGKRFEGVNIGLKSYPVFGGCQTAAHACIELAKQHDLKPEQVRRINVLVSTTMKDSFGAEKKRAPKSVPEAQFSLYYGPAVGMLTRHLRIDDFTEEALKRPEVLEMCKRIEVIIDPPKDALGVLIPPATVEIEMDDGRHYGLMTEFVPGHPKNPFSWSDITEKLRECARWSAKPLSEQRLEEISDQVMKLEELDDATTLLEPLVERL
jgi:2-methylcitrate dehydratase PrpD